MKNTRIIFSVLFLAICTLFTAQAQHNGPEVDNVYFEHMGFTGNVKILYDLSSCSDKDFYYVEVHHEDVMGKKTHPSPGKVAGAFEFSPVACGNELEIIWNFSEESARKQNIGEGEFIVEVFTIDKEENKALYRRYKRIARIDKKILKAQNKGKLRRVARLERRKVRKQKRYAKRAARG